MLDSILSQLMQALNDLGMLCRKYSLWVFLGLPVITMLVVMLQTRWERHKERQQAYYPACPEPWFSVGGMGYPPEPNRRSKIRRKMMGIRAHLSGQD